MLRQYQKEALKKALEKERSILVMPTGTGKTVVGIHFVKELLKKNPNSKALIIVPTRILVEQTQRMYKQWGLEAEKIYGIYRKEERIKKWERAKIAIATPETVYYDKDYIKGFDIVIVDECHHAIGNDFYVKALKSLEYKYILGLTAFISPRHRRELENLIGEIIEFPCTHPEVKKYIPQWIGDIYEAPFNTEEYKVYREIEKRRKNSQAWEKLIYTLALKYFACDGALALKESLNRKTKLSEKLKDLKEKIEKFRDLHKLGALFNILNIYDFDKAIIFVDRVVTAKRLYEILKHKYKTTLIIGRLKEKMKEKLEEAKEAKIIISTSAGEEGVDLPSADLLIVWSQTSNPLRFIQRQGRILRPTKPLKFATYIITPYTIDTDLFLIGLEKVKKYVNIGISEKVIEELYKESTLYQVIELLNEPMPEEWIRKISGLTQNEVREALKFGMRLGRIVYFYTPLGKTYISHHYLDKVVGKFPKFFEPKWEGKVSVKVGEKKRTLQGSYEQLREKLRKLLPLEEGLSITVVKKQGALIDYSTVRKYNYPIRDEKVLDLVLRNALAEYETVKK